MHIMFLATGRAFIERTKKSQIVRRQLTNYCDEHFNQQSFQGYITVTFSVFPFRSSLLSFSNRRHPCCVVEG